MMRAIFKNETAWPRALIGVSLLLSMGGVLVAVCGTGNPLDGGRGGALAVAATLVAYFLRRDLNDQLRKAFTETLPKLEEDIERLRHPIGKKEDSNALTQKIALLERVVKAIETSIRLTATSERRIDRSAAVAAAIGTLSWGFGDVAAGILLGFKN